MILETLAEARRGNRCLGEHIGDRGLQIPGNAWREHTMEWGLYFYKFLIKNYINSSLTFEISPLSYIVSKVTFSPSSLIKTSTFKLSFKLRTNFNIHFHFTPPHQVPLRNHLHSAAYVLPA